MHFVRIPIRLLCDGTPPQFASGFTPSAAMPPMPYAPAFDTPSAVTTTRSSLSMRRSARRWPSPSIPRSSRGTRDRPVDDTNCPCHFLLISAGLASGGVLYVAVAGHRHVVLCSLTWAPVMALFRLWGGFEVPAGGFEWRGGWSQLPCALYAPGLPRDRPAGSSSSFAS